MPHFSELAKLFARSAVGPLHFDTFDLYFDSARVIFHSKTVPNSATPNKTLYLEINEWLVLVVVVEEESFGNERRAK